MKRRFLENWFFWGTNDNNHLRDATVKLDTREGNWISVI